MAPHIRSWIWPCLILWFFTLNVGLMMPLIPNYLSYDLQRLIEAALLGVATLSLILSRSLSFLICPN